MTTISLSQMPASSRDEVAAGRLASALSDRVVIAQAKGVLTERLEIGVVDALSLMRNYARNTGQQLSEVAKQVIERSPRVMGLTRCRVAARLPT
ncbi:ANTAR domain-containing protein [Lentzea sp. NPDC059081]|uniref:ANTAR domain-containing protein n=1 Tax=Lentzea sp. NPDC059081 TaxID=3346719 RepID=UPI0036BCFBF5